MALNTSNFELDRVSLTSNAASARAEELQKELDKVCVHIVPDVVFMKLPITVHWRTEAPFG